MFRFVCFSQGTRSQEQAMVAILKGLIQVLFYTGKSRPKFRPKVPWWCGQHVGVRGAVGA